MAEENKVDLYNVNDGIHGRDGGPYLDQVEAAQFEKMQAAREGKKPNYDKPRSYPGIQLVPASVLVSGYNPTLIAGDDRRVAATADATIQVKPMAQAIYAPIGTSTITETDTEDKGDEDPEFILPVLEDDPSKNAVKPSVVI